MSFGSTRATDFIVTVDDPLTMKALQQQYLRWFLTHIAHGNKAEASRLLALDRSSLYRLLRSALSEPGAPRAAPGAPSVEAGELMIAGPDPEDYEGTP